MLIASVKSLRTGTLGGRGRALLIALILPVYTY